MQSSSGRIDDESKKSLLEVKKGKTRKFVMVKDGVQIDKLYVFKKGPHQRYAKQAKQDGIRGEVYWGVVHGDGTDIHFELSRSDGFASPPTNEIRLKEFLREACDVKFEPDFVIVDVLATVDETDEPQKPPEDEGEKFIRLLKSILPHVKRALSTPTSLSGELEARVREAQDLGRQREFEQGLIALRIVGDLTKRALAQAEATPRTAPAATVQDRVQTLRSITDGGELAGTSFAGKIDQRIQQAETLARQHQFERAGKLLSQVDRLIELAHAESRHRQQWEDRLAALAPRYDELAQSSDAGVQDRGAVMEYARAQADNQQFMKALVGLDRLETMLKAVN